MVIIEPKPEKHICNHCGTEMRDLVLSTDGRSEVIAHFAYEPFPKDHWLYACPNCGNVQIFLAEGEDKDDSDDDVTTDAGLVLDDRTKIKKSYFSDYNFEFEPMDIYELETRYGCSTREISLTYFQTRRLWKGDIIEFGEWRDLEWYEIEQCKEFLKEKGYL